MGVLKEGTLNHSIEKQKTFEFNSIFFMDFNFFYVLHSKASEDEKLSCNLF